MRKILRTNENGAGWTSWEGRREIKKFMLEYKPIIDYIEECKLNPVGFKRYGSHKTYEHDLDEKHPLVYQMLRDINEKFNVDNVYVGGAENLTIEEVPEGCLVYITDRDGYEIVEYSNEEWL